MADNMPKPGTDEWYRAQSDANYLVSAEEIKADPKRASAAAAVLQARQAALVAASKAAAKSNKR